MSERGPGLADLVTLGLTLALNMVVGFGLGWLLDLVWGTFPLIALVGFLMGLVTSGVVVYRASKKYI